MESWKRYSMTVPKVALLAEAGTNATGLLQPYLPISKPQIQKTKPNPQKPTKTHPPKPASHSDKEWIGRDYATAEEAYDAYCEREKELKGHVWKCGGCSEEYNVRMRNPPYAQPTPIAKKHEWLCPLCEYIEEGDGVDPRYVIIPAIRAKLNKKRTKTGYRGVGISEKKGCFTSNITVRGKIFRLGSSFKSRQEAYASYLEAEVKYKGHPYTCNMCNEEFCVKKWSGEEQKEGEKWFCLGCEARESALRIERMNDDIIINSLLSFSSSTSFSSSFSSVPSLEPESPTYSNSSFTSCDSYSSFDSSADSVSVLGKRKERDCDSSFECCSETSF